jgi:hypothetical protein
MYEVRSTKYDVRQSVKRRDIIFSERRTSYIKAATSYIKAAASYIKAATSYIFSTFAPLFQPTIKFIYEQQEGIERT